MEAAVAYVSHPSNRATRNKGISLTDAVGLALSEVTGTFGCAFLNRNNPNEIVGARMGSPLILGLTDDEFFLASDASAIVE